MDKLSLYNLQLKTLSEGTHHQEFDLDNQFFADVEGPEINAGDVKAQIEINKTSHNIELTITLTGQVETTCDRCLDSLWVDIDVEESLYIKFGKTYSEESDDLIVISEEEGVFNIAWTLYEFCALAIPICHSHADGECNAEMMKILNQHSVREIDDESEDGDNDIKTTENDEVDPRWAALKNIFNN